MCVHVSLQATVSCQDMFVCASSCFWFSVLLIFSFLSIIYNLRVTILLLPHIQTRSLTSLTGQQYMMTIYYIVQNNEMYCKVKQDCITIIV